MSSVAVDKFGVVGENMCKVIVPPQQIINRNPLLKYRYLGSFSSDYVPILLNETFAIINTQPSYIQGEHWIMIANSCQKV